MSNTIKVTYIVSDIDKAIAFEWIATYLDKTKFDLSFILLNPGSSQLEQFLIEKGIRVNTIVCKGKESWPLAWWQLFRQLKSEKPRVVHCHLLQANILGLSAAKMAHIEKRIYTRHHSVQHHVSNKKGVYWDKLSNALATDIIAISPMVEKILIQWEGAEVSKVHYIPHGFLLESFSSVAADRINAIRNKYDFEGRGPVVGVISRFTQLKGIQFIIPAFAQLLKQYPDAILLLFSAQGDYAQEINRQLEIIPNSNFRKIIYESDIAASFKSMDIFLHVPIDEQSEAFGQIYIEALAAGVPSIFTLSGIAPDFIRDKENALVVSYQNSNSIYEAMTELLLHPELREKLSVEGPQSVKEKFSLENMIVGIEELYMN